MGPVDQALQDRAQAGLTRREIRLLVDEFVGNDEGGQWGGFSHERLSDFLEDLELDPSHIVPTTSGFSKRQRMRETLIRCSVEEQTKALIALLQRFPAAGPSEFPLVPETAARTNARLRLQAALRRLQGNAAQLPLPDPSHSERVRASLAEARTLVGRHGAGAAVDRAHTALHAYLQDLCERSGIVCDEEADASRLYRLLRDQHPLFQPPPELRALVERLLQNFAGALGPLNQIRNDWSRAHPNEEPPSRFSETALDVLSTIFRDVQRTVGG